MRCSRFAFLFLLGCGTGASDHPSPPQPQVPPAGQVHKVEFTSPDGRFSVVLPATPKITETQANPRIGKVEGKMYVVDQGELVYWISWARFSTARTDLKKELAAVQAANIRESGGTLRTEGDARVGTHLGKKYVADCPDGSVLRGQLIISDFESYQVFSIVPKSDERTQAVEEFFSSFKLLK